MAAGEVSFGLSDIHALGLDSEGYVEGLPERELTLTSFKVEVGEEKQPLIHVMATNWFNNALTLEDAATAFSEIIIEVNREEVRSTCADPDPLAVLDIRGLRAFAMDNFIKPRDFNPTRQCDFLGEMIYNWRNPNVMVILSNEVSEPQLRLMAWLKDVFAVAGKNIVFSTLLEEIKDIPTHYTPVVKRPVLGQEYNVVTERIREEA